MRFKFFLSLIFISFLAFNGFSKEKILTSGNLSIGMLSLEAMGSVLPGDSVTYSIFYYYQGDVPADNVLITDNFPPELSINLIYPQPSSNNGNVITWNLGTLQNNGFGSIVISCKVKSNVSMGTTIINSVNITSNLAEEDTSDNSARLSVEVKTPQPDLWVFQWGIMENSDISFFPTAEKDVPVDFEISYMNFSKVSALNTVITDTLQDGLEFVSAIPTPSSVNGNVITWDVNSIAPFSSDKISLKLKPTATGQMKIIANAVNSNGDSYPSNNRSVLLFTVVNILPPVLLKPNTQYSEGENPLIMGKNPKFEGLAKAGSKVTIYEGDSIGYWGDISNLNLNVIGSVTTGPDRKWQLVPTTMNESRKYYLYFQAELNGEKSAPFMNVYSPLAIEVNSILDSAGFDFDHFVIQTGDQEVLPGALGGSSGTVPYEDIVIKKRFKAPPSILTDTSMWDNHKMKLVVTENGNTYEQVLPLARVEKVNPQKKTSPVKASSTADYDSYDFIYVQKGFGPGATVEVWCLPIYYTEEGLPLVGLVWIKCHEILIDPAGYVYDEDIAGETYDWPAVPPENSLIKNATVTAMVRTGDDSWERWKAEETGQVNPQITDDLTEDKIKIPGYFAFYVPSGQYRVEATAPNYVDVVSPILTVVDEPVFYNVAMKKSASSTVGIKASDKVPNIPSLFTLEQNYPNPFNPVTTIGYSLPVSAKITLKIYNALGKEVATLIPGEYKSAGRHVIQFNASSIASGVYFYRLSAGNFSATKKFVVLK